MLKVDGFAGRRSTASPGGTARRTPGRKAPPKPDSAPVPSVPVVGADPFGDFGVVDQDMPVQEILEKPNQFAAHILATFEARPRLVKAF